MKQNQNRACFRHRHDLHHYRAHNRLIPHRRILTDPLRYFSLIYTIGVCIQGQN